MEYSRGLQDRPFEALKTVKQNGYDGVEFAGYHGHSAAQIKEMLEQLDLAVAASHIPFEALRDRFEETVALKNDWQSTDRHSVCQF